MNDFRDEKMYKNYDPAFNPIIFNRCRTYGESIGMLDEINSVKGLDVYGPDGIFVGKVADLIIDTDTRTITGLYISEPSPVKAANNVLLKIPYRWIQSIGDVVILKTFPKYIDGSGKVIS